MLRRRAAVPATLAGSPERRALGRGDRADGGGLLDPLVRRHVDGVRRGLGGVGHDQGDVGGLIEVIEHRVDDVECLLLSLLLLLHLAALDQGLGRVEPLLRGPRRHDHAAILGLDHDHEDAAVDRGQIDLHVDQLALGVREALRGLRNEPGHVATDITHEPALRLESADRPDGHVIGTIQLDDERLLGGLDLDDLALERERTTGHDDLLEKTSTSKNGWLLGHKSFYGHVATQLLKIPKLLMCVLRNKN